MPAEPPSAFYYLLALDRRLNDDKALLGANVFYVADWMRAYRAKMPALTLHHLDIEIKRHSQ